MLRWPNKDPNDIATYSVDWAAAIGAGDSLASCEWAAAPVGLTLAAPQVDGTVASITISGGTAGEVYAVRARAILASGQQLDQSQILAVLEQ